jgi:hypothetical protein
VIEAIEAFRNIALDEPFRSPARVFDFFQRRMTSALWAEAM